MLAVTVAVPAILLGVPRSPPNHFFPAREEGSTFDEDSAPDGVLAPKAVPALEDTVVTGDVTLSDASPGPELSSAVQDISGSFSLFLCKWREAGSCNTETGKTSGGSSMLHALCRDGPWRSVEVCTI